MRHSTLEVHAGQEAPLKGDDRPGRVEGLREAAIEAESWSAAFLRRLVRISTVRPLLTIAVCCISALVGAFYAAIALSFQTSSVELLPPHRPYVQRFKENLRDFGELNDIVVVVEGPSLERAQDYADRLAATIKTLPGASRVSHRIEPDMFAGHALLYLSLERLAELRDALLAHRRFIDAYAAKPTLAGLLEGVNDEIGRRIALGFFDPGLDEGEKARLDPGFIDAVFAAIQDGLDGRAARTPWTNVLEGQRDGEREGYFLSGDRKLLFILVEARREAGNFTDNEHLVAGIRGAIRALASEYPDVGAGVTGTPALSNDEMLTAFHDSGMATVLAFTLTLALLLGVFRRFVEPLAMLGVLAVSLGWSLGIVTATVGHLTVFSVMFISLLIGIGIDYGVYLLFRYEAELRLGRTSRGALETAAARTGPGILFGALAAAGTFGVLGLTDFRGVQEFGFIAGTSILMAFVAMMTLFPALLVLMRRRTVTHVRSTRATTREDVPALHHFAVHRRPILVAAVLLTGWSLSTLPGVQFDYNRLNLQARGTESVIWEQKIMASRRSGFAALATATSLPELRAKQAAFERLPAVSDVVSVLTVLPAEQDAKLPAVRALSPLVSQIRFGETSDVDPAPLGRALVTLQRRLGLAVREADPGPTLETLRSAHARAAAVFERLQREDPDAVARRLAPIQARLREDFVAKLRRLQDNVNPRPMSVQDLPGALTRKLVGRSGHFLMLIYPAVDTWQREGARYFVDQLRSVDPAVTGSPVISYEASRLVEAAYSRGTFYAVTLAALLALVMLRRVSVALLALTPLLLATVWTIGLLRLFGIPFNLANVWGVPLIVGAAAEFGLNVTFRHREGDGAGGRSLPASTVMAVLLNGLTTIVAFGSLMVARHQGIFGLGLLLTVGAIAGLAASLIVLPLLLSLLVRAPSAPSRELTLTVPVSRVEEDRR